MAAKNPLTRLSRRGGMQRAEETIAYAPAVEEPTVDLRRRHDQLQAKVAELQWDLGGMVYEMAVRDRIRMEVIVKHAAQLQEVDAELAEIDRIIALEHSDIAGACGHCGAPHARGAAFCWQCGAHIVHDVDTSAIFES